MKKLSGTLLTWFRHEGFRLYGGNILYLFSERAVAFIFGFVVGVYVARGLGPERYGLLSYAVSLTSIFGVIMTFGLESVMVRELVSRPSDRGVILGSGAMLKLCGFVLMQAALWLYLFFLRPPLSTGLLIVVISGGYLFQILQVLDFYFQSEVKSKYVSFAKVLSLLFYCMLRFLLILLGADLLWFALAEALNMAVTGLWYLYYYLRIGGSIAGWRFSLREACGLLRMGWPFYLSSAAIILYMRADQIIIKSLAGDTELGLYSIAVRLVELFYFIPVLSCASLLPALLRARSRSEELYRNRLALLFGVMFYLGLGCVLLCIAGSYLVKYVYGMEYAGAASLLRSYSWVLLFVFTSQPLAQWYIVNGTQSYALLFALCTAVLNIFLNYLLVGGLGVSGAVYAALLSYFLVLLLGLCIPGTRFVTWQRLTSPYCLYRLWRTGGGILR